MNKARFALFAMLLTGPFSLGQESAPAAPQFTANPLVQWPAKMGGNDHYYEAVAFPGGINWADATAFAAKRKGHLVTVASAEENNFVFALIDAPEFWFSSPNAAYSIGPWIGGFQPPGSPEPAGGWEWVNGEGSITYFNWLSDQPDNSSSGEDNLNYLAHGATTRTPTWNDTPNVFLKHGVIVEYETDPRLPARPNPAEPTAAVAMDAQKESGVSRNALVFGLVVVVVFALVTLLLIWLQRKDKTRQREGF